MYAKPVLLSLLLIAGLKTSGQRLHFTPEFLGGHRSLTYAHIAGYSFTKKLHLDNLTYIDGAYASDKDNIYFVRTKLSYKLFSGVSVHAAIGLKNPGKFTTLLLQYRYVRPDFHISYAAGPTYQNGFTLEQSLATSWQRRLTDNTKLYLAARATINLKENALDRGVQQIRIGLRKRRLTHGLGANFDQFQPGVKPLFNAGIFISYLFEGFPAKKSLPELN